MSKHGRTQRLLALSALGSLVSGCAGSGAAPASVDVSVLRVADDNHVVFASPEALASDNRVSAVIVAGEVSGFEQGRTVLGTVPDDNLYNVVMRVRVTEPLKGVHGKRNVVDGHVYVELAQGPLCDPGLQPCRSLADFETAIPHGTLKSKGFTGN
jgi:hypothetical protein